MYSIHSVSSDRDLDRVWASKIGPAAWIIIIVIELLDPEIEKDKRDSNYNFSFLTLLVCVTMATLDLKLLFIYGRCRCMCFFVNGAHTHSCKVKHTQKANEMCVCLSDSESYFSTSSIRFKAERLIRELFLLIMPVRKGVGRSFRQPETFLLLCWVKFIDSSKKYTCTPTNTVPFCYSIRIRKGTSYLKVLSGDELD